mmetsp:Transcript_7160/g.22908  ORF Transcript_7160/g.22908 Transcript_7160/m.22908 type:complete len:894 (-) Transcript_7160:62-2743(-)|eukprot:CAMPEP_0170739068 /NCGR_PEP_ID=MMETSP0437-20130122/4970_1 /TAXON_ID=0 /ORGANISM="Sexangularia sp." /LENGTH=893 /DNA_ID=CAMNT_0011077511 /DNA_START=207 /DNA_END=2888 /DNA_ORIENTATION=-
MGRYTKKRNKGKKRERAGETGSYTLVKFEERNLPEKFRAYYSHVHEKYAFTQDDEDLTKFFDFLSKPLPTTWRVSSISLSGPVLQRKFETSFPKVVRHTLDGVDAEGPAPLPWYPHGLAWGTDIPKKGLRSVPALKAMRAALVAAEAEGAVTRQEAVSMVPPFFLGDALRRDAKILDLCASPGSKTSELVEFCARGGVPHEKEETPWVHVDEVPTGMVIANDVDRKRCYTLTHQLARFSSPAVGITCWDAEHFPSYSGKDGEPILFDGVLADVPCSGDGTFRKNATLWDKWSPAQPLGLHRLQVGIVRRGLELLRVGGTLVFSTCSLNPVEDEAVVAAVLRLTGGSVELVDVSAVLPKLKRRPGLVDWPVQAPDGTIYDSFTAEAQGQRRLLPSMFADVEANREMCLERCMRFLPQDQNTGGFFIAVLRKTAETPNAGHRGIRSLVPSGVTLADIPDPSKAPEGMRPECTVQVYNIAFSTVSNDALAALFTAKGFTVTRSWLAMQQSERRKEQCRGFGSVQLTSPEDVERALVVMEGVGLDGRKLRFDSIAAKEARAADEAAQTPEANDEADAAVAPEASEEKAVEVKDETDAPAPPPSSPTSATTTTTTSPSSSSAAAGADASDTSAPPSAASSRRQARDPPFQPLSAEAMDVEDGFVGKSLELLGLTHVNADSLMHRSGASESVGRNVSLVSPALSDFVQGTSSKHGRPPLVLFAGVHFLTRRDATSATLRPCQDGVHWYSVLGAKNTVAFTADDMILMLRTAAKSSNIVMPYDRLSASAQASLATQHGGHIIMRGSVPRDPLGRSVSLLGINNDKGQSILLQASSSYVATLKTLFDIGDLAGDDIFTIEEVDLFQVKRHKSDEGEQEVGEDGEQAVEDGEQTVEEEMEEA